MSGEEIIIPTSYIRTLISQVEERGFDSNLLLDNVGIDPSTLDDQCYFPAVQYGKLYQQAMFVMQDEWFGMLSGGRIRRGTFRLLSLLMVQCKTLRQVLIRCWEFCQICRGFKVSIQLEEIGDVARVRLAPLESISEEEFQHIIAKTKPVVIHTTLATWQQNWGWLIGTDLKISRSFFTFSEPSELWEMAELNPDETIFNHDFNGIEFPAKYLDYAVIQTEDTVENFVRTAPFGVLVNAAAGQSTKALVKAILNQNVGHAMLGAERVAERLNMSVTTLRRHLQVEGASFQRLKDECRMEAAFHFLACPDLSNQEIANRLGFDEASAFFRAFKKWTGITPGQYRSADHK